MYWQISVTIMSFGDQGGSERNGPQNLCTVVMTHNDLCTSIALIKWDGLVACVNVTENVEIFQSKCYHFTATKTSVTVSVKQYEHDRVTRWTFSVDFKEIKTITTVALKGHHYISFSLHYINFDLCEKTIKWLCIHNYLACIHNYLACIHKYLACIHNYLACIHN